MGVNEGLPTDLCTAEETQRVMRITTISKMSLKKEGGAASKRGLNLRDARNEWPNTNQKSQTPTLELRYSEADESVWEF